MKVTSALGWSLKKHKISHKHSLVNELMDDQMFG